MKKEKKKYIYIYIYILFHPVVLDAKPSIKKIRNFWSVGV